MTSARRFIGLLGLSLAIVAVGAAPLVFPAGAWQLDGLAGLTQIGGPLAATLLCLLAARNSHDGDRLAWLHFAIGSGLYVGGNLFYLHAKLAGLPVGFPSLAEASYFLMAGFFAAGMFHYGKVRQRISRMQLYNFVLICCSVILAILFLLHRSVAASVIGQWPTVVAFVYPALWFSVAGFGLISIIFYDQHGKRLVLALLLAAVLAEAVADFNYALALMHGAFPLGGLSQVLWVASAGLICWAAAEQMLIGPIRRPASRVSNDISDRTMAQAALPAVAAASILVTGSLSGVLAGGPYIVLSTVLAVVFAVITGFREHWMIHLQRQLRGTVDRSLADLGRTEARLAEVLSSTSDSVLVLDSDWNVAYFNRRAVETINLADRLHIGISVWDLFPAALTSGEGDYYKKAVATGEPQEFEIFVQDRGVWLGIHAYPGPDNLSIFFRDISDRKRAHDEILHLAHHDSLTGLANRALFQDRLKWALDGGGKVAALLIDLDHFKEVNDTLGHPVGDALLSETAERLRACVRAEDTIARLGGDEFAIIFADYTNRAEVQRLAQRVLAAVHTPYVIDNQPIRIAASLGIALSTGGNSDPDRLFKNADIALYVAKADARGTFCFFAPEMELGVQQRQALRTDLAEALENNQFKLVYQPLVNLRTNTISSFEALLRWHHPVHGIISPELFIPIAEETGLIVAIGDWVLHTACTEALNWPASISVAVNLSTRQFSAENLIDKIEATLAETGFDHARLELEITESVLLKDSKANTVTLKRLRELGIRIALDDFGTGYSSLGYLQKFQFSKLKIDRSFISGLPENEESQAIVRAVTGLGKSLGMKVTAEGVETAEQLDWIRNGCDEAQGYLLSRPVAPDAIPELMARLGVAERVQLAS